MNAHAPAHFVKTGGVAGIIASLFGIASFLSAGSSPDASASVEDITNYVVQGRTGMVATTVLLMLAAACLCCFAAVVANMVREREGGGPLPGLLILAAALTVSLLAWDSLPLLALSVAGGLPSGAGDGTVIRAPSMHWRTESSCPEHTASSRRCSSAPWPSRPCGVPSPPAGSVSCYSHSPRCH
jgi:hypothetical protein